MKIKHKSSPEILSSKDLRNGQVYERISKDDARFYIKTDEAFLVNLLCGTKMGLDYFEGDKFIHHPNATLVL